MEKSRKQAVVYIHGQGGSPDEAAFYKPVFSGWEVLGFDYAAQTPWEAETEFSWYFEELTRKYDRIFLIANSIGAYFSMCALGAVPIEQAFFISPVVDMARLIEDMMIWAGVTEAELCEKQEIQTAFGQTLSWEYLQYAANHPVQWDVPTHILYGGQDNLTSRETITGFARRIGAELTVMEDGEHWFHTPKQMEFLTRWLKESI